MATIGNNVEAKYLMNPSKPREIIRDAKGIPQVRNPLNLDQRRVSKTDIQSIYGLQDKVKLGGQNHLGTFSDKKHLKN